MHLCLFEDRVVPHLSPLTHTRGVYQIRTGALTNLIRIWEAFNRPSLTLHARSNLASLIHSQTGLPVNHFEHEQGVLFINGRVTRLSQEFISRLTETAQNAEQGRRFIKDGVLVAAWVPQIADVSLASWIDADSFAGFAIEDAGETTLISRLWQLIDDLQTNLVYDIGLMKQHVTHEERPTFHESVMLVNTDDIFISPTAKIHPGALLNATDGPIYLDHESQVMERSIVRGPFYLGQKSVIKARADVSKSALGPVCKAGGEVVEAIMQSFSNKAHEGFLGHAYMGSWCNIGAGTNASNLKNDYSETKLFNEVLNTYEPTGRQFLGVIMGDHSKIGISSMVNTASVVGVACNLFGSDFLPRYLPSFSWGSPRNGFEPYRLDKAFEAMERVMARRSRILSDVSRQQLASTFKATHEKEQLMIA